MVQRPRVRRGGGAGRGSEAGGGAWPASPTKPTRTKLSLGAARPVRERKGKEIGDGSSSGIHLRLASRTAGDASHTTAAPNQADGAGLR